MRGLPTIAVLALAGWLVGCASAPPRETRVREAMSQSRYRDAADVATGEGDELLRHLDRGLALFYARDSRASNLCLGRAETLIDERYTRSLAKAALSLVLNDKVLPYQPDPWERLMIPLYRALNYVAEGEPVDAAVEARRLSALLLERRDRHPERAAEENDAFLYAIAGTLFEWAGRPEDAAVAYRNARAVYGGGAGPTPGWLPRGANPGDPGADPGADHDDARGSDKADPAEEATAGAARGEGRWLTEAASVEDDQPAGEEAGSRVPPAPSRPRPAAGTAGELVLLIETGFVAPPVQELILVFLSEDEAKRARDDPARAGDEIAKRYLDRRARHDGDDAGAYLLPIALRSRPLPAAPPDRATLEVDGRSFDLPVAFDLSRAAALAEHDELPILLAKTAARAVVKWSAFKEATDHEDAVVRLLANVLHVATEKADTRAWLTLPAELRFARLDLTPGVHDLRVRVDSARGARLLEVPGVRVAPGRPTLVTARVY